MHSQKQFGFFSWLSRWAIALGFWRVALLGVIFVCGLIVSIVVFWLLKENEKQLAEVRFSHRAGNRLQAVERTLTRRLAALDWISAFYAASENVDRHEFRIFTQSALARYADIELLAWSPRVPAAAREAHEDAMRRKGFANYQIRERTAHGNFAPAGKRKVYYPLIYLEPFDKQAFLLGFDLGSGSDALAAIDRTLASRKRTLALTTFPDRQGGLPAKLCLFKSTSTATPSTDAPASAWPERSGVILGTLQLSTMIENTIKRFAVVGIDIYLFEEVAPGRTRLIFSRPSPLRTSPLPELKNLPENPAEIHYCQSLTAADRTWHAYCTPCDVYVQELLSNAPWAALAFGLVATVLITAYFSLLLGWSRQANALVQQRTADLRKEQQLLRHLLDLQERDRMLTSYEIHDGLAQLVTGALMKLQALEARQEPLSALANELLHASLQMLQEGTQEARRLIGGLRPPILDELGIVPAIEYLVDEHQRRHPVAIEFRHQLFPHRLAAPLEASLFRITQECLSNAIRHSQSPRILIELLPKDGRVQLHVQDWGVGFDPDNVIGEHFGLRGIHERVRLLDGVVTVKSTAGEGTIISVELSLVERPQDTD